MNEDIQQDVMEFDKSRNQLLNVTAQKQQVQFQSNSLNEALNELEKTKEKKVYKAVGNILVLVPTETVKKELKEQKESADLRIKTLQKQEDLTIEKLNKLKHKIESKGEKAPEENKTEAK